MLAAFGLPQQEARLYAALHAHDLATGYELAMAAGMSRSNAYAALSGLVDKGAAMIAEGKPARYRAVPIGEFADNRIRTLLELKTELEKRLVPTGHDDSPYLTIRGSANIADKIKSMIAATRQRIYLAMPANALAPFKPLLAEAATVGRKVVVVTNANPAMDGVVVHRSHHLPDSLRVIADGAVCLAGDLDGEGEPTCLYSTKKTMVNLLRESIRNEIRLIERTQQP
jgi:sugar-specific transcriptional regulator TrmB